MSQFLSTVGALLSDPHLHILAEDPPKPPVTNPIPDFTPTLPDNVKNPTGTILGWTAGGGLALATLGGLVGFACVGIGENTDRGGLAARGKKAIVMSLVAGIGIACIAGLVFAAYKMAAG
ncbi:hypothetical protein OG618_37550 (plasmid) [Kitasatospora sp. NBC_01246]|uniref:hypothetical protein n=1 Tax=Kitasatospora sp. NBC_01246 TaxID=2903570 RepID=UPI002E37479F|nr:hypothetical protein [Kitasatospora sp. NBC_01246]